MSRSLGSLSAEETLRQLRLVQRQHSRLDARRLQLLNHYQHLRAADGKLAARSAPYEIALELHLGTGYARDQVALAEQLTERLPDTLKAMAQGKVELVKARALVEITEELSLDDAQKVEAKVLPTAEERTVSQVRASARYFRDRFDPEAAERRRERVRERRMAEFVNHDDGEARLSITGPGERVYLAWLVVDAYARQARAAGDPRTLDELRHDIALDLLLGQQDRRVQVQAFLMCQPPRWRRSARRRGSWPATARSPPRCVGCWLPGMRCGIGCSAIPSLG
jgi:Domain of unknown function (DUF222)